VEPARVSIGEMRLQNEAVHSDGVVRSVARMGMVSLLALLPGWNQGSQWTAIRSDRNRTGSEDGELPLRVKRGSSPLAVYLLCAPTE
jgi:hypothetical protein